MYICCKLVTVYVGLSLFFYRVIILASWHWDFFFLCVCSFCLQSQDVQISIIKLRKTLKPETYRLRGMLWASEPYLFFMKVRDNDLSDSVFCFVFYFEIQTLPTSRRIFFPKLLSLAAFVPLFLLHLLFANLCSERSEEMTSCCL